MRSKPARSAAARQQEIGPLLSDAVRLLRKDFYQRAKGLNLTPALARLMYYVNREAGSSQVELAAKLEITPVTEPPLPVDIGHGGTLARDRTARGARTVQT